MKIILNNREEEFTGESLSVMEMLEMKKFTFRMRIIKKSMKNSIRVFQNWNYHSSKMRGR